MSWRIGIRHTKDGLLDQALGGQLRIGYVAKVVNRF